MVVLSGARSGRARLPAAAPRILRFGLVGFGERLQIRQRGVPSALEPLAEVAELAPPRRVVAEASLLAAGDQAGLLEDAQMLRDGAEADVGVGAADLAGGMFPAPHEAQDLASARSGEGLEDGGGHGNS